MPISENTVQNLFAEGLRKGWVVLIAHLSVNVKIPWATSGVYVKVIGDLYSSFYFTVNNREALFKSLEWMPHFMDA